MFYEAEIKKHKWYQERIAICNACPLQSDNFQGNKGFKYRILNFLNLNKPFCTECGCEIKAKVSEELEKCPEGKWNKII